MLPSSPPPSSAPDYGLMFVEGSFRLHAFLQQMAILLIPVQGYDSNFANNYRGVPTRTSRLVGQVATYTCYSILKNKLLN
jgi:hypothetical protein